jgi:hypothetical protein
VRQERPTLKAQVEMMRHEVDECGESIVRRDELRVLCEDLVLSSNQWEAIAKIAINEGWSFTYFPDGSVRFAKL